MNDTEQALTEAVAQAIINVDMGRFPNAVRQIPARSVYIDRARAALSTIRAHDEQSALNCGHCDPNTDEIVCACQIKERDDE